MSHKTNTWIDGNGQGSSLWRCVGTLQTCFSHDHSASHRTESERSSPPSLSHGAVPSGPTRRTEHSNTARAEHSKFHSHKLDTFPSIYRSWRERGKPIVSAARIPPMSTDTPRGTGLAGENPPHPRIQQRTLLIRSAPHSEVALDPEADTQGLIRQISGPAEVFPQWVRSSIVKPCRSGFASRARLARPVTTSSMGRSASRSVPSSWHYGGKMWRCRFASATAAYSQAAARHTLIPRFPA